MQMEPEYVAKRSKWKAVTFWRIILAILIVPLIMIIVDIIKINCVRYEFYSNRIIVKSGVLNKKERQMTFNPIMAVSVNQSLFGRMFNYGDIHVDTIGKWDLNTQGIKDPESLKQYLIGRISEGNVKSFITE